MPPEPEKKIEPLISAYAESRRRVAGDAPAMHPATRRLLQSEVRRHHPAAPADPAVPTDRQPPRRWYQVLGTVWPRLATAGAIMAMLGLGLWLLMPSNTARNFASAPAPVPLASPDSMPERANRAESTLLAEQEIPVPPAEQAPRPDSVIQQKSKAEPAQTGKPGETVLLRQLADTDTTDTTVAQTEARAADKQARYLAPPAAPAPAPAPAPTPTSTAPAAPASAPSKTSKRETEFRMAIDETKLAVPGTEGDVAAGRARRMSVTLDAAATRSALAPTNASINTPMAPVQLAESLSTGQLASQNSTARQSFFRNTRPQRPASAARYASRAAGATGNAAVLTNFAVEQNGPVIRVVDADGSIYQGQIVPRSNLATAIVSQRPARGGAPTQRSSSLSEASRESIVAIVANPPSGSTGSSELAFEVSGTNETLRQAVFLSGTLVFNANPAQNTPTTPGIGAASVSQGGAQPTGPTTAPAPIGFGTNPGQDDGKPQLLRILGRGRLGRTNEFHVDAVPVTR